MCFKMVHFWHKKQNLELVNLKCATYAQPISLSLMFDNYPIVELKKEVVRDTHMVTINN